MLIPHLISTAIWAVGVIGTLIALALICRRRLVAEFPFFTSYLIFHTAIFFAALLILRHYGRSSWPYLYEYWVAQAIGLALRFAIIYEIFSHVCRPYEGLRRASRLIFRWGGVVLILAAISIAVLGPSNEPDWAVTGAVVIERSIDVVQCGLLGMLFLFASYFALSWRNYVFGIALAFGIIATVELMASALAAQLAPAISSGLLNFLPRVAYDVGAVIWVAYLVLPEPSRQEIKILPQHDLEKWNRELLELLQR